MRTCVARSTLGQALAVAVARRFYAGVASSDARRVRWPELDWHLRLLGATDFRALAELADRIVCPALVLHAVDDRTVEPEIGKELSERIRGAIWRPSSRGGHGFVKRDAERLAKCAEEFLQGLEVAGV
jgi:pimeloyl-ACP methyl ester carboxylesterase